MEGRKSDTCKIKRNPGMLVIRNEEIQEVWKGHSQSVMTVCDRKQKKPGVMINVAGWLYPRGRRREVRQRRL